MDRNTVYRGEIPYETDVLGMERFAYEGLGLLALDIIGSSTVVSGLHCDPTSPASMAVKIGPGRIYTLATLEPTDWGKITGTGGFDADTSTDHRILKQGLNRDTTNFATPAPITAGQSINYLIEAQFSEADTTPEISQFFNVENPQAPLTQSVSKQRLDKCLLQIKAGTSATTGSQTTPAPTAGWVPLWVITVAYGATTVISGNIVQHGSAPLLSIGGGGGGVGMPPWSFLAANHNMANNEWVFFDTTAGGLTATLWASPAAGDSCRIKGNFATNNLTVARNGHTIVGSATNLTLNKDFMDVLLTYDGATWRI